MVLLPLLYPELIAQMQLSPPRGVLFVGPPGTGKTLLARALANEGSRGAHRPVTFFMRKGADMLSKWVGESERQLSLLFDEARRLQPSIIFFDEIDGLAPTRHTKTEQTQAALVATLLALLDGLEDRGNVVVIGATNRPDTIDPALRRPGRFDQELVFPTPDKAARRHILRILTSSTLLPPSHPHQQEMLEEMVEHTEGCTGADLKALCTEASLNRLRSALPHLYTSSSRLGFVMPSCSQLQLRREDFFAAMQRITPSLQRSRVAE
uniref:ATPase family AAA domain-containing protein 2 n=1 Tax=Lygus hesperus TaxID=30085 RepID=A0A0A9WJZ3_LYGHE